MTIEEAVIKDFKIKKGLFKCPLTKIVWNRDEEYCNKLCPITNICYVVFKNLNKEGEKNNG